MIFDSIKLAGEMFGGAVIAIGNFDGLHIGHQEIIKTAIAVAKQKRVKVGVLTFNPHPAAVLGKAANHKLIMPIAKRTEGIFKLGVDFVILNKFDQEFAQYSGVDFVTDILNNQLRINHCVTGYNFRFGRQGSGDVDLLDELSRHLHFGFTKVNYISHNGTDVSTSTIKSLLQNAQLNKVNKLLGRNFVLTGKVQQGEKLLGVFTINVELNAQLPLSGVYLVSVGFGHNLHYSVANVEDRGIKLHLYDFEGNLDGRTTIDIELLAFIRPERKFNTVAEKDYAIEMDKNFGRYLVSNIKYL